MVEIFVDLFHLIYHIYNQKKYVYVLPLALYTIFLLDIQIYSAPAARSA